MKPELYIHVDKATHFLRWEMDEFKKYFRIVDEPSESIPLLSFGPDVLQEAAKIPASKRFAVLFPGFGHNPLYNPIIKKLHLHLIKKYYDTVFINPGPLEIAYKTLDNVDFYPFSIDTNIVKVKKYRKKLNSLLHVSSDYPQKDWRRSELIMQKTQLKHEVYPPRDKIVLEKHRKTRGINAQILKMRNRTVPPDGYVDHYTIIKKYQQYDGFVHIARDIKDPLYIDGKYTASLIEAGATGSLLFWHDTLSLGNSLETVFNLPLDPDAAAQTILYIRSSIDVEKHSRLTQEEMIEKFNRFDSVKIRAEKIIKRL